MATRTAEPGPGTGGDQRLPQDPRRVEAFSDAVMAVIITIMAFGVRAPAGATFPALGQRLPSLLIYILSFTTIGMAWNHHHQLLHTARQINAAVMWANLHSLFWLSLVPIVTQWVGSQYNASLPASAYGAVALASAAAYAALARTLISASGTNTPLSATAGSDRKNIITMILYAAGIGLAWASPWISYSLYIAVAMTWFTPDRRLTRSPMQ